MFIDSVSPRNPPTTVVSKIVLKLSSKFTRSVLNENMDFYEYRENLDKNITNLVKRLKQKNYRAKLVRRQYIPKIA